MMCNIKEETLKVEVKSEDNLDNEFLPENRNPVGESIDSVAEDYGRFKIKKEFDYIDNIEVNTDSLKQVNSTYADFTCKDEEQSEICNGFITENQQNIDEFPKKREVDEIDISETILQSSYYNFKHEKENDAENQKAFTQRNSADDDHKEKKCRSTMRSNSIHAKKAKTKNCQFCNRFFTTKRYLDDHILKHHKQEIKADLKSLITNKIFTCNICNSYETTDKRDFDRHVNSVHKEATSKMKCQFCTKSFTAKPSLDGHVLRNHKDTIKKNCITSKIHVCKICNSYETTAKWHLDRHINWVHNKVKFKMKCQFCTKSFICKQALDGHVLKKHKDEIKNNFKSFITSKIHVCKICNSYETTVKAYLDQHINLVHNEAKVKVECQFCTKSFFFKKSLHEHVLKKHKDQRMINFKTFITSKIHVCKICNSYETTYKSSLDQHINTVHNKVKSKIKCQFCTKSFLIKRSLDDHVLKKHKDEMLNNITSKIHICKICKSYETTRKTHLDRHINSVHNEVKNKI